MKTEYSSSGKPSIQYLSGAKIDEIIFKKEASGERLYYLRDGLNSVRLVVDAKGNIVQKMEYTPFGEMKGKIDGLSTIFGFTGREYDSETGLYFYRARYYVPDAGRFLSEDPIGILGGMNLYAYCGSNPVNLLDPWGLKHYSAEEVADIKNDAINGLLQGSDIGSYVGTTSEYFGGGGKYDYKANEPSSTFEVNGETLTAGQFGNYLAGFATYYVFQDAGAIGTYMAGDFFAFADALYDLFNFEWPDYWFDNPDSVYWINRGINDAIACLENS